jgi:HPt (histidine-containing phosphotransfer) domain-containing protein
VPPAVPAPDASVPVPYPGVPVPGAAVPVAYAAVPVPYAAVPVPDAAAEVPLAFDAAALHALGEDIGHDGVAEMLEVFQQETWVRLQRMTAAGIPSVNLMREAHTLKGAAGTVCAPLLRRRAEAIEARLRAGVPLEPGDIAGLSEAMQAFTAAVEATSAMSRVVA